jgi:hypothetical protein
LGRLFGNYGRIRPVEPFGKMSSQSLKSDVSSSWGVTCRPTLLFVVAFALNVTPHEVVHVITSLNVVADGELGIFRRRYAPKPTSPHHFADFYRSNV